MTATLIASVAVTVLAALAEVLLGAAPHGLPPGATGAFGLAGCVAIVAVAKALGKRWLQRPEPPDE